MSDGVDYHPLDFAQLDKGDRISPEECERALNAVASSPQYMLRMLGLKDRIERELLERGKPATIRIQGQAIVICTDEEASEYNPRQYESGVRRAIRSHARNMHVDKTQLADDAARQRHNRNLLIHGSILAAINRERKRFRLDGQGRSTPGLPGPDENEE